MFGCHEIAEGMRCVAESNLTSPSNHTTLDCRLAMLDTRLYKGDANIMMNVPLCAVPTVRISTSYELVEESGRQY